MADVDQLVLGTVNASWRRTIDASTLLRGLHDSDIARDWAAHFETFFEEVPREVILSFIRAHGVAASQLVDAYRHLVPAESERNVELERWLAELADAT